MRKLYRLVVLSTLLGLCSCGENEPPLPPPPPPPSEETAALYILCEGLWGNNNSTLAYYSFDNQVSDNDYFNTINGRGLGDTGNDMKIYGSKIYIAVTTSSQIEVIDAHTGLSLRQLPVFDEGKPREPRHLAFDKGKVYATCFDGTIIRIDTLSLEIDNTAKAGRDPEGICVANGKLYVANSGGKSFPNYDNTISVIDIASFKEVKKIEVAINPYIVEADGYGDVYVSSQGNYNDKKYKLQRINSQTDKVEDTFDTETLNFCISGDYAYLYNYDYSNKTNWVKVLNVKTEEIERENFITDGTEIYTPRGIAVNAATSEVFISDAFDFMIRGTVFCFNENGTLKYKIEKVGITPNQIVFVNKEQESN